MHTPQVPALQYMSPLGFQLLNVACRDCQRTTEDDSADHDTWIDGLCLYCQHAAATVPPALVVPDTEKEPQKSSQRAETWLCYACDCEYVDGEESCHNPRCPEGIGTVKAPSTGDVLKPAGWSGPAKGTRYNLLDSASLANLLTRIDGFGSYLYK